MTLYRIVDKKSNNSSQELIGPWQKEEERFVVLVDSIASIQIIMDDRKLPPDVGRPSRKSSFANSFWQGAENGGGRGGGGDGGEVGHSFPMPRNRGRRQSERNHPNRQSLTTSMEAAAEAAIAFDEDEPNNLAYGAQETARVNRHNSWYVEALQQGGENVNLEEILGASTTSPGNNDGFDDEEVLEQYRIMAQHEANLRVKENTGFDMADYEKRRKMQGNEPVNKKALYGGGKKSKIRLPDPKKIIGPASGSAPKPEEPPLPTPKLNTRFQKQKHLRVPEMCAGMKFEHGSVLNQSEEHAVRCLGCKIRLRVKLLATLVSCPECNTVSPASSTRR